MHNLSISLDMIGFASFNIINVDFTKYLLGFVCLQLLMEHVTIPIVMIRSQETLNSIESHRIKWTFLKQVHNDFHFIQNEI